MRGGDATSSRVGPFTVSGGPSGGHEAFRLRRGALECPARDSPLSHLPIGLALGLELQEEGLVLRARAEGLRELRVRLGAAAAGLLAAGAAAVVLPAPG